MGIIFQPRQNVGNYYWRVGNYFSIFPRIGNYFSMHYMLDFLVIKTQFLGKYEENWHVKNDFKNFKTKIYG
jgi:hypothetical protein